MSALAVPDRWRGRVRVLQPRGLLDLSTYPVLRDAMIKCAVDEPDGVVVDLTGLTADRVTSLSVFPTVALRISPWPDVPLALAAPTGRLAELLATSAVHRFVPVYPRVGDAIDALGRPQPRQVARMSFPAASTAPRSVRRWIEETCRRWDVTEPDAAVLVASELVTNVVRHADCDRVVVRLELRPAGLSVAVTDTDPRPPVLQLGGGVPTVSGLTLVDTLARTWGHSPRWDGGKVVWAVVAVSGGPAGPLLPGASGPPGPAQRPGAGTESPGDLPGPGR